MNNNNIHYKKNRYFVFFILYFFTIIMISIDIKKLWALEEEEDSDLIIHQAEEQRNIQHIQDKFIINENNNKIKHKLEDITGYTNKQSTEQDNKTIITYSLNNNDNIKKIIEIQEKDTSQQTNKYIRQYFISDAENYNKIKEEEYDVNKKIVRLDEIKDNTTNRYKWKYDSYNQSTYIPKVPTVYSLITITHQENIKKEVEKSRVFKEKEDGQIKINWKHSDNFNKVIVYEELSQKETIKQRCFTDEIDNSIEKQKIDWANFITYDKIIEKSRNKKKIQLKRFKKGNYPEKDRNNNIDLSTSSETNIDTTENSKEITKYRCFKNENSSANERKINWSNSSDKIIDKSQDKKEKITNICFKNEDYSEEERNNHIDWNNDMTSDTTIDTTNDGEEITQYRRFKEGDYSKEKRHKNIEWSNIDTYDQIIVKSQNKKEITSSIRFKEGDYSEDDRNKNINWLYSSKTIIDKTKDDEETTQSRFFTDETDTNQNPKINWSHPMTFDKTIKTKPNQETTHSRYFKEGDYSEADRKNHIDWLNIDTYDKTIDTTADSKITQSRHFKEGNYPELERHNNIEWSHYGTFNENIYKTSNDETTNEETTQSRCFKNKIDTDINPKINWSNSMTFDKTIKTKPNQETTHSRYFKEGDYSEEDRKNHIDWSQYMTFDKIIETKPNQEIIQCRRFKNENYSEEDRHKNINWSNSETYDLIKDKINNTEKKIHKKDFKKTLFENKDEINVVPDLLHDEEKIKSALESTLTVDPHELKNIFRNLVIKRNKHNEIQLTLKEVTDEYFPSQEPVILKSSYVASSSSNPANTHVINNQSVSPNNQTKQEKKSFSLWLIIPSIMIIGFISYLVYLYINKKRP